METAALEDYGNIFTNVGQNFRPLTPKNRTGIEETRLRVEAARSGETIANVLRQANGTWTAEKATIANALGADAVLGEGQLIKVPMRQPYRVSAVRQWLSQTTRV